jgi:prepilin-type N-terminal cleavage/methylation domain-containing protein
MNRRTRGFSLIELLVVIAIILVILAIALPNVKKALLNTTETAVIREVQTINQAQMQYQSQYGRYAATLAELGPPGSGTAGPQAAELIPGSLASGEKDGYLFTLTVTPEGYAINANPKTFPGTGRRTFYSDANLLVHQNWGQAPADRRSPEVGGLTATR